MAHVINVPDARGGYKQLVEWVFREGVAASPRGQRTKEVISAVVVINDPEDTLPVGIGRSLNTGIAAVEACQLLASESRPELVIKVGPQFTNFTEDNGNFHGAYGLRTEGQYAEIVKRLQNDPDSRQAVVTIWDPELDGQVTDPPKRDYPCTILHQFFVRGDALDMLVYMRSNDVWKGCGYDFFQFTRVQIALASVLGVEIGRYEHHVGSLHLYSSDWNATQTLVYPAEPGRNLTPSIIGSTWDEVQAKAKTALDAAEDDTMFAEATDPGVRWNAQAMRDAIARNVAKTGG